jgi:DNA-binding transcriptional ArsR family regulator
MKPKTVADHPEEVARFLSLLANGKRLAIIHHLLHREMSVGAIADLVSLSQSALSQHLAKLRSHDIVQTRREGQTIYYSCRSEPVRRLIEALDEICRSRHAAADRWTPDGDLAS